LVGGGRLVAEVGHEGVELGLEDVKVVDGETHFDEVLGVWMGG
jgi:hypothetical protein